MRYATVLLGLWWTIAHPCGADAVLDTRLLPLASSERESHRMAEEDDARL
jgi:hypothetical protein